VPNVTVDGIPLVAEPSRLATANGHEVTATRATVQAVPADEGFWVGEPGARVWVQFSGAQESRVRVTPRQALTFTGRVMPNTPAFLSTVGLAVENGRAELEGDGYHLEVDPDTVRVVG
jgi:hypothetical protein